MLDHPHKDFFTMGMAARQSNLDISGTVAEADISMTDRPASRRTDLVESPGPLNGIAVEVAEYPG